ncbi:phage tail tip lysozyme [Kribbella sp. NPDC055071]
MDSPAGKLLQAVGGLLLFFGLALVVVIALILGGLSNMDAQAATCDAAAPDNTEFAWPTDKHEVAQGWQDPDENGYSHSGVDFKVDEGSKVFAAADGQVASIANNEVVIKHEEGVETHYKYFHDITTKVGDKVTRGEQIGTSGSGDEATPGLSGQHLHFELWIDKQQNGHPEAVDPGADAFGDTTPAGGGCGCGGGGLTGGTNVEQVFNYLTSNGFTPEQAAGITANMIHESAVLPQRLNNTSEDTITTPAQAMQSPNNTRAWGLVQWYPGPKMINASRAAGKSDEEIGSLKYQLDFVLAQLKGSPPLSEKEAGDAVHAAKTPEDAAFAFAFKFERFSTNPNDAEFDHRRADARNVFNRYGANAPKGGGCAAGAKIAATARSLAWDTPGHGHTPKPMNPTYEEVERKYNGSVGYDELTDCGVFVATVMIMSGVDPDYTKRLTSEQRKYVRGSPKYQKFENLTIKDESQLRPGDIFVHDHHTFIYTGDYEGSDGNTYNAAAASLNGHVPQADHVFFSDNNGQYTVARFTG